MTLYKEPLQLEVLERHPPKGAANEHPTPLLFVHGAFSGAWIWDEFFLPYFAEQGYHAYAVSLRGHGDSQGGEDIDWWSIADYVDDVRATIARMPHPPVLIGHSMGGFIVQKIMEKTRPPAVALLATVPPQGLLPSSFTMAFTRPDLMSQINRVMSGGMVKTDVIREGLFAQDVDEKVLEHFYFRMQTESQRAIWDMSLFDLPLPPRSGVPPMLVLGAAEDQLVPSSQAYATGAYYGVKAEVFDHMGHCLMLERDWEIVAQRILRWLSSLQL